MWDKALYMWTSREPVEEGRARKSPIPDPKYPMDFSMKIPEPDEGLGSRESPGPKTAVFSPAKSKDT
jgi:hypothetical protein